MALNSEKAKVSNFNKPQIQYCQYCGKECKNTNSLKQHEVRCRENPNRKAFNNLGNPFEVKVDEPNAVTYAAMEAAEKGEDMYGPFDSVADLMEALNA